MVGQPTPACLWRFGRCAACYVAGGEACQENLCGDFVHDSVVRHRIDNLLQIPVETLVRLRELFMKRKEERNGDKDQTVVLRTFTNDLDAEIAKDHLLAHGIEAFVSKDDAGGMRPHLQLTMGVRLLALESDADRASEILDGMNVD